MNSCLSVPTVNKKLTIVNKPIPSQIPENWFDYASEEAIVGVDEVSIVPSLGASYNVYLTSLVLQNANGAANTYVTLTNNSLLKLRLKLIAGAAPIVVTLPNALSGSGATPWVLQAETVDAEISWLVSGFKYAPCLSNC